MLHTPGRVHLQGTYRKEEDQNVSMSCYGPSERGRTARGDVISGVGS